MGKKRALVAGGLFAGLWLGIVAGAAQTQPLPRARPEEAGMSSSQLAYLDRLMEEAVAADAFPGAVVVVGRRGRIVYQKAFGSSQLLPERRPMEPGMMFDLASVTKPVATATSVMILVERGRLRLWDKVKTYLSEFLPFVELGGAAGDDARLFHLLTHTSGLPPYTDAGAAAARYGRPCPTETLVRHIAGLRKESRPGETFTYSCLNYITLAWIVERVSGKNLAEFAAESIFRPLKMDRTTFRPPAELIPLCAPTQAVDGEILRGIVHDPLARLQDGISGNAGLFSTADDLAVFCQMMLGRGEFRGARILSPLSVSRMTEVFWKTPAAGRGFGWDLASDYATVRGDLFGRESYGHSGYTGTSLWIDPEMETFVILLTNRVHPDDTGGDVIGLRSRTANIVAAAIMK